jgi:hypothetical protein
MPSPISSTLYQDNRLFPTFRISFHKLPRAHYTIFIEQQQIVNTIGMFGALVKIDIGYHPKSLSEL